MGRGVFLACLVLFLAAFHVNAYNRNVFKGRLQIYTTDHDNLECLTSRSLDGDTYLAVAKCRHEPSQTFVYNSKTRTLSPADNADIVFTIDPKVSARLRKHVDGAGLLITGADREEAKWTWDDMTASFFDVYARSVSDSDDRMCMSVQSVFGHSAIVARYIQQNDTSMCTDIKLMLPSDDFVVGHIRYMGGDDGTELCVAYEDTDKKSVLSLARCDRSKSNQRFMYNMITEHLRSGQASDAKLGIFSLDSPAIFFWWSGALKSYPQLPENARGHGWRMPIVQAGSVLASDDRGFSGLCWTVQDDGQIVANQTCGLFSFRPDIKTFFASQLASIPRGYTSVVLMVYPPTPVLKCVWINRQEFTVRDPESGVQSNEFDWRFNMHTCDYSKYHLAFRFVFSQDKRRPCDMQSCIGMLRWSGDMDNVAVLPLFPETYHMNEDRLLGASALTDDQLPFEYDIPYKRVAPIYTTSKGGRRACWSFNKDSHMFGVTSDLNKCVRFSVLFSPALEPDADTPDVFAISRFDATAMSVWPRTHVANQMSSMERLALRMKGTHDADARKQFFRIFDAFYGDLGVSGRRGMRQNGHGLSIQPDGDVAANVGGNSKNGVYFSLLPSPRLQSHKYAVINFYFRSHNEMLTNRNHSYMLFNFARQAGCVVYLTPNGHVGLKCYHRGNVMSSGQVMEWPEHSFTLLDGATHKISLLFSTKRGETIELFVDGQLCLTLVNPVSWDINSIAPTLRVFLDVYFWQYQPFSASLHRFALVASDNWQKLRQLAVSLKAGVDHRVPALPGDIRALQTVNGISTKWVNCQHFKKDPLNSLTGFTCTLSIEKNGRAVAVPQDAFSLACSRPHCQVFFQPNQPSPATSYRFTYLSGYPKSFESEFVGNSVSLVDNSLLTDGFVTSPVTFNVEFQKKSRTMWDDAGEDRIYWMKKSCCADLGDFADVY